MKYIIWLIIGIILIGNTLACVELPGPIITTNTELCSDTYDAQEGIRIEADNIKLDCGTAVIRGNYQERTGITLINRKNVTITKCNVLTYNVGVFISNSTNIYLYENALLKNDVGVRLYNSYENIIEKHNDKSLKKPISALTSKYNIVLLGNKNIDRDFCEVNACNTYKDMNPCEDNDFYCSERCTTETDSDCRKKQEQITAAITENTTEETSEAPESATEQQEEETETTEEKPEEKSNSKYIAYPIVYLIGLLIFQFIRYVKEFDREDI